MEHSFNIELAKEYGVNSAILIKHLYFWIDKNRANNKHFIEDRYWTYNSVKAFSEMFSYLTEKQIRYALKKLEEEKIIVVTNHNETQYDRTLWYAFTDYGISILNKNGYNTDGFAHLTKGTNGFDKRYNSHLTKSTNGFDKKYKPIPDNIPDNIPDIKKEKINKKEKEIEELTEMVKKVKERYGINE